MQQTLQIVSNKLQGKAEQSLFCSSDDALHLNLSDLLTGSLTNQLVEDGVICLAESSGSVKLHHIPRMHYKHTVTVHDGVDSSEANRTITYL